MKEKEKKNLNIVSKSQRKQNKKDKKKIETMKQGFESVVLMCFEKKIKPKEKPNKRVRLL